MARAKTTSTTGTKTTGAADKAAPAVSIPAVEGKAPSDVIVALNQPHGITFRLFSGEGDNKQEYKRVSISGNASHLVGWNAQPLPVGAYGMTTISAEDWDAIRAQYGHLEIFKRGLIFAASSRNDAQMQAADQSETRHGLEPIDVKSAEAQTREFKE